MTMERGKVYICECVCMQKRKDKVINTKESGSEHDPAALISRHARLNSKTWRKNRDRELFSYLCFLFARSNKAPFRFIACGIELSSISRDVDRLFLESEKIPDSSWTVKQKHGIFEKSIVRKRKIIFPGNYFIIYNLIRYLYINNIYLYINKIFIHYDLLSRNCLLFFPPNNLFLIFFSLFQSYIIIPINLIFRLSPKVHLTESLYFVFFSFFRIIPSFASASSSLPQRASSQSISRCLAPT